MKTLIITNKTSTSRVEFKVDALTHNFTIFDIIGMGAGEIKLGLGGTFQRGKLYNVENDLIPFIIAKGLKLVAQDLTGNPTTLKDSTGTISGMSISTSTPLNDPVINSDFNQYIVAAGGNGQYTFTLASDSPAIPAGLTLLPNGLLTGLAKTAATTALKVKATDCLGASVTKTLSITVIATSTTSTSTTSTSSTTTTHTSSTTTTTT